MGRSGWATRGGVLGITLAAALWICCPWPLTTAYPLPQPLIPQSGTFGSVDRPALWQLPEGPVERVLVIYTPMKTLPQAFWDYSPSCPSCIGLPEKRKIVADALARNCAVFVPQQGDVDGQWEPWPEDNPDLLVSLEMIAEWKTLMGLDGYPTVGLGISAGGLILSTVGLRAGLFDAICIMISPGVVNAYNASTSAYPPTVFFTMPADTSIGEIATNFTIAECNTNARRILESNGVPTLELTWYPTPITPEWFSDYIPRVNVSLSNAIFSAIRGQGWSNEEDFIITDSWMDAWPADIRRWNLLPTDHTGELMELAVRDEILVAWGVHTTIARFNDQMFAFLEEHTPITSRSKLISSF